MIQNDTFYFEKKENVCFGNGYFVNLEKGGPGKESWRFAHFHLLPQELKLFDGKIFFCLFLGLCKYHCWSTCFCPYFYYWMLWSLHHTSIYTFVLWLLVIPPILFPFSNLVFQKVFLQWSLFEIEWNKFYCFSFFKQSGICDKLIQQPQHSEGCDQRNRGFEAVAML